jgi:hypothetical protein
VREGGPSDARGSAAGKGNDDVLAPPMGQGIESFGGRWHLVSQQGAPIEAVR